MQLRVILMKYLVTGTCVCTNRIPKTLNLVFILYINAGIDRFLSFVIFLLPTCVLVVPIKRYFLFLCLYSFDESAS